MSCRAELIATNAVLDWLTENSRYLVKDRDEVRICTDSQAAIKTLERGPSKQKTTIPNIIWSKLKDLSVTIKLHFTIQWVPSHCGLLGNEMADVLAKEAAAIDQAEAPIDQATSPHL
ncbi:non-ltr retrotransposon cats [Elysia marginata]|uniref:Non-ltr retrotransposon cats n=1 Tax=Elysia marginata TaxID=1093978 RepID=A0AAV4EGN6_9GAST|nr:non-ltr retrotransposon cats [Elysia marginata]